MSGLERAMEAEEIIALFKRTIVYITRPVNQMSDQAKKDVDMYERLVTEYGGDTRNDLRALKITDMQEDE